MSLEAGKGSGMIWPPKRRGGKAKKHRVSKDPAATPPGRPIACLNCGAGNVQNKLLPRAENLAFCFIEHAGQFNVSECLFPAWLQYFLEKKRVEGKSPVYPSSG